MVDLLKEKYSSLTTTGKKIADFIINNADDFLSMNANQIGEGSGTSSASVVRFAKSLGFNSLEELKIATAKNLKAINETEPLNVISSKDDDSATLIQKLTSNLNTSISSTLKNIDLEDYEKAINYILSADCVHLYGIGASGLAASDLYHKFNRANIRAMYSADTHMGVEFSYYIKPTDVVIAFSYSGITKEINLAVEKAKENGAKVIVITREGKSKLTQNADIVFSVPYIESVVRIGAISSKYSSMAVGDLLFLGIVNRKYDEIEEGFIETSRMTRKLKDKMK